MRLAIITPTAGMVRFEYAFGLADLVGKFTIYRPEDELFYMLQPSSVIHMNREVAVYKAVNQLEADYVLFIDDDMAFNYEAVDIMLKRNKDIVLVNYPKRQFPISYTTCYKDFTTEVVTYPEDTGLEEIGAGGFGFSLISSKVFKALDVPYFCPVWNREHMMYTTEDIPFYVQAITKGFQVWVDHDASKHISHCGHMMYNNDIKELITYSGEGFTQHNPKAKEGGHNPYA